VRLCCAAIGRGKERSGLAVVREVLDHPRPPSTDPPIAPARLPAQREIEFHEDAFMEELCDEPLRTLPSTLLHPGIASQDSGPRPHENLNSLSLRDHAITYG
jgi:hypothetical protein